MIADAHGRGKHDDDTARRASEWPRAATKLRRVRTELATIESRDLLRDIRAALRRGEDMRVAGLIGGKP